MTGLPIAARSSVATTPKGRAPRGNRQPDRERGAAANGRANVDRAAQIRHDSVHQGQAQAGSLADAFGGEKRSNIRSSNCGGIPLPVSLTLSRT